MPVLLVIPARYASTRFPGKPLVEIRGATGEPKSLIQRTWETAQQVKSADRVVIATDDTRIRTAAEDFGAEVIVTSSEHSSGTDRIAEVVRDLDAKVVINCTSIGMHPDIDNSPLPANCINCDMAVFDTVYNPLETLLLKYAKDASAKTINGAEMFIRQAMAQYKIFTGNDPDEEVMRKTVFNALT